MKAVHEKILEFITGFMLEHDYPPTVREIAKGTGYSSSATIFGHLLDMQKAQLIDYNGDSPRTIRVPGYHYIKFDEGRMGNGTGE